MQNGGVIYSEDDQDCVVTDHDEVVVVAADEASTKNTIKITESLIAHANTHYGRPFDFDVNPLAPQRAIESSHGFRISFERTPRVPDDNKLHQLPGSLGSHDLFSVEAYADRLPASIGQAGGVFFPMWQREAMWLNFQSELHKRDDECAVRVFAGQVNAISGLNMNEASKGQHNEQLQDYIVIPNQPWLDGICVAPGIVRQFVAMPRMCPTSSCPESAPIWHLLTHSSWLWLYRGRTEDSRREIRRTSVGSHTPVIWPPALVVGH